MRYHYCIFMCTRTSTIHGGVSALCYGDHNVYLEIDAAPTQVPSFNNRHLENEIFSNIQIKIKYELCFSLGQNK